MEVNGYKQLFAYQITTFFKISYVMFHKINTPWGWVNKDNVHFWVNPPFIGEVHSCKDVKIPHAG